MTATTTPETAAAVQLDPGDLSVLVPSWTLSLRAGRKADKTIKAYLDAARQFPAFLTERGMPTAVAAIRREHVEAFIVDLMERLSASTAATRFRAAATVVPLA